ncbi:GNAT family N-acetyltransferase [Nocardioidaceae bacterium SCSIO 66511]|nr:GNAT family N-acetyltransferase [Nocardioidaceae bacterium SCSIO 66511]
MTSVLADPSLYRHTGGEPPTEPELVRRYSAQVTGHSPDGSQRWVNLVVTLDRQPIGYVQATVPVDRDHVEIAWVIGRPWQGRGYAKRAAELLVASLADWGVRHVVAHIHPDHLASQRVALHLGMVASDDVIDGETRWVGDVGLRGSGRRV